MTQQGRDRRFGHGDEITVENTSGSTIEAGELVYVTGYNTTDDRPEVQPADSGSTTGYNAVAGDAIVDGDYGKAVFSGTPWVRVVDGDDVSAGDEPAASTTAGVATDSGTGGDGKGDVYLTGETDIGGTTYAVLHLS